MLLVDDNAEDRALAVRALQREHPAIESVQPTDQRALTAALAAGGFDLVITDYSLRWSDGLIALLLTDVVLQGASGPDLARALQDERPELRVLYTSGYTETAIVHRGVLDPRTPYLQKPFAPSALAHKVREVLDA